MIGLELRGDNTETESFNKLNRIAIQLNRTV
uniref:Uncharacterized protein n=1 Tax=Anguilla anguilla TaxID=7936 RepID=A0A0E9SSX7_ANGAN